MNAMTEPLLFKQTIEGVERELVSFATHPAKYQHWTLDVNGDVAKLKLDINEDGGIRPGYKLKLNSYDLGVDIELHDALNTLPSRWWCLSRAKKKSGARAPTSTCWACQRTAGR